MSFSQGLRAGMATVEGIARNKREQTTFDQQQEDRKKQQAALDSYQQLQKDYYTNQGDFSPKFQNTPEAQTADASYDRVEQNRMGLMQTEPAPAVNGVTPVSADGQGLRVAAGPSLSMSGQQLASTQPQAMSPQEKDAAYYAKLGQWAQTNLPPEKAMAYLNDLHKFKEENYQQQHTEVARAAASGDRAGLEQLAGMHNGLVPDGYHIDTSKAVFDPSTGDWHGVFIANGKGDVKGVSVDHKALQAMWADSSLPNVLALRHQVFSEDEAAKKGAREDKKVANDSAALGIRSKVADSAIAKNEADVRQGDARVANEKARLGIAATEAATANKRLGIAGQELELKKQALAGDEKAKDMGARQVAFEREFGYKPPKRDPLTTDPAVVQQYAQRQQAGQQLTSIATEIYGLSSENVKPAERNAVHSETSAFMRQFGNGTLDASKVKDNGNGTFAYGRVVIPADLMQAYTPKTTKPGLSAPGASGAY